MALIPAKSEFGTNGAACTLKTNLWRIEEVKTVNLQKFTVKFEVTDIVNDNKGGKGGKKGKKGKGKGKDGKGDGKGAAQARECTPPMRNAAIKQLMADLQIPEGSYNFDGFLALMLEAAMIQWIQLKHQYAVSAPSETHVIHVTVNPTQGQDVNTERIMNATSAHSCLEELSHCNLYMRNQARARDGVEMVRNRALFFADKYLPRDLSDRSTLAMKYSRELNFGYLANLHLIRNSSAPNGNGLLPVCTVNLEVGLGLPSMSLIEFVARWLNNNDPQAWSATAERMKTQWPAELTMDVLRALVENARFGLLGTDAEKPNIKVTYVQSDGQGGFKEPKKKKIIGISEHTADSYIIPDLNKSVTQYFYETHWVTLQYPHLPLVEVQSSGKGKGKGKGGKGKGGKGGESKTLLPMEFFTLAQKSHNKDINIENAFQGEMTRKGAMHPLTERLTRIEELKGKFVEGDVSGLGMKLAAEALKVQGRKLEPFRLRDANGKEGLKLEVNDTVSVDPPAAVDRLPWAMITVTGGVQDQQKEGAFARSFHEAMTRRGFAVGQPLALLSLSLHERMDSLKNKLKMFTNTNKTLRLLLVCLPDGAGGGSSVKAADDIYRAIKEYTELRLPSDVPGSNVVSQFVRISTKSSDAGLKGQGKGKGEGAGAEPQFTSKDVQKLQNVAVKVITKLRLDTTSEGGAREPAARNYDLHRKPEWLEGKNVMFVGGDVSHSRGGVSVAAMVSTTDDRFVHYFASASPQDGRKKTGEDMQRAEERILTAGEHLTEQLKLWHARNGCYPDAIVYYRDGMSEGEFRPEEGRETTFQAELREMGKAAESTAGNKIPMAGIVCVKRHHVRFFAENPDDQLASPLGNENPYPGTVVSDGVCNPDHANFFLISQLAGKGTARPCNYYFLHNDPALGLTIDTIEELTLYISSIYSRAQTPVGIASPAYMAHHMAERALTYLFATGNFEQELEALRQAAREQANANQDVRAGVERLVQVAHGVLNPAAFARLPLQGVQFFC